MGLIQDVQKAVDKGIKDIQKQADAALGKATGGAVGTTSSNASGKSSVPSFNIPAPSIPTPSVNIPTPNLDQDLTKLTPKGLQSEAVDTGAAIQAAVTNAGSALQQNVVDVGSTVQQAVIDVGSMTGQSNPVLEAEAERWTQAQEANIQSIANFAESNVEGFAQSVEANVEGFVNSVETNIEGAVSTLQDLDFPLVFQLFKDDKKWEGPDGTQAQPLPEAPTFDNNQPFEDIETGTTKADQMTEEERLRRIRRLMLNRYGREDTILTGTADTTGRRRTAPGFMGL